MSDENTAGLSKTGFSGLSDLTSDISTLGIPYNESIAIGPHEKKQKVVAKRNSSRREKSGIFYHLILSGLVVLLFIFIWFGSENQNSPKINSMQTPSAQEQSVEKAPELPPKKTFSFQQPPAGTNLVLNVPQIRWCLREEIILDTVEPFVDNYSQSSVNAYNLLIDEYNCRCGSFRYRSGDLARAKRDIESMRGQIIAETIASKRQNGSTTSSSAVHSSNKKNNLVLRVQTKLTVLGYHPGPLDGVFGKKTEKAIRLFQKDAGLKVTGEVNSQLIQEIENAVSNSVWLKHGDDRRSSNADFFTIGSHKNAVLRLQGKPSNVARYSSLGEESWSYGHSTVEISTKTNRVIAYANISDNLKVKYYPGDNITESRYFTEGSHVDDVIRLQGTPDKVTLYSSLNIQTIYYDDSHIDVSTITKTVIDYVNTGNLKVR